MAQPVAEHVRAVGIERRDGKISTAINGCGVPLHYVKTMEEAVQKFALAQKGDAGVSPACASLDMFRNFHRAEVFVAAVRDLQAGISAMTHKVHLMIYQSDINYQKSAQF